MHKHTSKILSCAISFFMLCNTNSVFASIPGSTFERNEKNSAKNMPDWAKVLCGVGVGLVPISAAVVIAAVWSRNKDKAEDNNINTNKNINANLTNAGNTCYFDSLLQMLYSNESFREFIENCDLECVNGDVTKSKIVALRNLFGKMKVEKLVDIKYMKNFFRSFALKTFKIHNQQDIRETFDTLMPDVIERYYEYLNSLEKNDGNVFCNRIDNRFTCNYNFNRELYDDDNEYYNVANGTFHICACGGNHLYTQEERAVLDDLIKGRNQNFIFEYSNFSALKVAEFDTVQAWLDSQTPDETGHVNVACDNATVYDIILPTTNGSFSIFLDRVHYDSSKGTSVKLPTSVCIFDDVNYLGKTYKLCEVSVHDGGAWFGHHYVYKLGPDGNWYKYDDMHKEVSCVKLTDNLKETIKTNCTMLNFKEVK